MISRWERYRLYRYTVRHFAIDCVDCNRKIANLKDSYTTERIAFALGAVNKHETTYHKKETRRGSKEAQAR